MKKLRRMKMKSISMGMKHGLLEFIHLTMNPKSNYKRRKLVVSLKIFHADLEEFFLMRMQQLKKDQKDILKEFGWTDELLQIHTVL